MADGRQLLRTTGYPTGAASAATRVPAFPHAGAVAIVPDPVGQRSALSGARERIYPALRAI